MRPWVLAMMLVACKHDYTGTHEYTDAPDRPDAGPDASYDAPDAPIVCGTIAGAITTYPGTYAGTVLGAGADNTVADGVCANQSAWYEPKGEDTIVGLSGLTAGKTYIVELAAADDLGIYVATSCPPAAGAIGACLAFADEVGNDTTTFVATATEHFLVVDNAELPAPVSGAFTVSARQAECTAATEATDCVDPAKPICESFTCIGCRDSFDCPLASAPVCAATACTAGTITCVADDLGDVGNDDDGPAGARSLDAGGLTGTICSSPLTETDYYQIAIAAGQGLDVTLAWTDPGDLDLTIYDATGTIYGYSYRVKPERVTLTYLPTNTYAIAVTRRTQTVSTTGIAYSIDATVTAALQCASAADCAATYATQVYRGACDAATHTCGAITQAPAASGPCDDGEDCATGICSYTPFEADAQDSVCTIECLGTPDCAALGAGFTCIANNYCVPACTTNVDCGARISTLMPDPGLPWDYLTCDAPTGECLLN